eukprot:TRINITY_DN17875_c0_g3_i1.p1 TRINITY_DN17875_c0_g3~~TRINITY_DN17875_c0_g3_i1.p1  ORF type:complete len:292 (+),score=73.48 TRINITY_DN17875_c0_g3_i1:98-973(+)
MAASPCASSGCASAGADRDGPRLDVEAYPAFAPLLGACQEYAALSGCRYLGGAFSDAGSLHGDDDSLLEAKKKAAPVVEEFKQRLMRDDKELISAIDVAYDLVMAEGIRNGIKATCQALLLWPPETQPPDVPATDCAFEDMAASLPVIAQRAYNDELRRQRGEGRRISSRASTASFLVDFAGEAGKLAPCKGDAYRAKLEEFMAKVEEWTASQHCEPILVDGKELRGPAPLRRHWLAAATVFGVSMAAHQGGSAIWEVAPGIAAAGVTVLTLLAATGRLRWRRPPFPGRKN